VTVTQLHPAELDPVDTAGQPHPEEPAAAGPATEPAEPAPGSSIPAEPPPVPLLMVDPHTLVLEDNVRAEALLR
jgi:hypothetical protein